MRERDFLLYVETDGRRMEGTVKNGKAPEERTVLASSYSDPLTKLCLQHEQVQQ